MFLLNKNKNNININISGILGLLKSIKFTIELSVFRNSVNYKKQKQKT